jgi:hypothetical protein
MLLAGDLDALVLQQDCLGAVDGAHGDQIDFDVLAGLGCRAIHVHVLGGGAGDTCR